jgi:GTPase SAR1 family protein
MFSVVHPLSLEHVEKIWVPEIKEHCPATPYILVGMNCDLREVVAANPAEWKEKEMEAIPESEGEKMKAKIGANAYLECSAKMQINTKEIFETAIKVVIHDGAIIAPGKKQKGKKKDGDNCEVF